MPATHKVSLDLSDEAIHALHHAMKHGKFASEADAVEAAVRLLARQQKDGQQHLEQIRQRILKSLSDARPSIPAEQAVARMAEFKRRQAGSAAK